LDRGRTLRLHAPAQGGRLDVVLVELLEGQSRSRVQKLIRGGRVEVEGRAITKTGYALEGGEELRVHLPKPQATGLQPEAIPLDIIYEDQDLIIVNKPPGMVVHPSAGHAGGTLVHAALAHAPDIQGVGEAGRPGVVHRLDKDTSGLILLAKHDEAHRWLQRQFKDREVKKTYLALVEGVPPTPAGRVEAPIGRDPKHRQRMAVVPKTRGREAVSIYRTRESFQGHALLEVEPETGRTHQIRVHLAFLGCPVVGDRIYGRRRSLVPAPRQMLHAHRLVFRLPSTPEPVAFEAGLPADFQKALEWLRGREGAKPVR